MCDGSQRDGRGKRHRLSPAGTLKSAKSSSVPAGGWTEENYHTENGRRLVLDLVNVERVSTAKGIRELTPKLTAFFEGQISAITSEVASTIRRIYGVEIKAAGDVIAGLDQSQLWFTALERALGNSEPALQTMLLNSIRGTVDIAHTQSSLLLGVTNVVSPSVLAARTRNMASLVTRINDTTRDRLRSTLQGAFDEGLDVQSTIQLVKDRFPKIAANRIPTIVRTELGRASDEGRKQALIDSGVVTHVSVVGCQAIEDGIPTFRNIPTCNIRHVPIEYVDELFFHPNHTGTIIPSHFKREDGTTIRARPRRGKG